MSIVQKKIKVGVYDASVVFMITDSMEEVAIKTYRKTKELWSIEDADGCVFYTNSLYHLVLLQEQISHNLIAHEVFHLSTRICEDRYIEDEETKAWLTGHLTENLYKFLDKKKINIKL
jgi:hypothetical protein